MDPNTKSMSKNTEGEIIGVAEALLAATALTTVMGLLLQHILQDICVSDWRFLGASPFLLMYFTGYTTLTFLLIKVALSKSIRVLNGLRPTGRLSRAVLFIFVLNVPFSMTFTIFISADIYPLSREKVVWCSTVNSQTPPR